MSLKFMYITNSPQVASIAQLYGVDRVFVDLETLGKEERQKGVNSVKSHHKISDICAIKPILTTSEMLVRINPINAQSENEIDQVIKAGADIIMLPMWKTLAEVQFFLSVVQKRVKTILLLETKEAIECIDDVLSSGGFDEIHVGLNDLHLSYGLTFMFELLSNGMIESLCNKFKAKSIPYGYGGIARLGEGMLPAENLVMEHYRLGSTRTILSRSFCNTDIITDVSEIDALFQQNMTDLKMFEEQVTHMSAKELIENKRFVDVKIQEIVNYIKSKE